MLPNLEKHLKPEKRIIQIRPMLRCFGNTPDGKVIWGAEVRVDDDGGRMNNGQEGKERGPNEITLTDEG